METHRRKTWLELFEGENALIFRRKYRASCLIFPYFVVSLGCIKQAFRYSIGISLARIRFALEMLAFTTLRFVDIEYFVAVIYLIYHNNCNLYLLQSYDLCFFLYTKCWEIVQYLVILGLFTSIFAAHSVCRLQPMSSLENISNIADMLPK